MHVMRDATFGRCVMRDPSLCRRQEGSITGQQGYLKWPQKEGKKHAHQYEQPFVELVVSFLSTRKPY